MPPIESLPTRERQRLNAPFKRLAHPWQKWDPYVSERAWGNELFPLGENPATYDPAKFEQQLRKGDSLLR